MNTLNNLTEEGFRDCVLCKHKSIDWNEEPCIKCTNEHNCYEPLDGKEKKNEREIHNNR